MLKEFRDFIARGNVLDLAVGVIIGLAFGKIVTTLVEGIIMPPIGMLLGNIDFSNLFIVLNRTLPADEIPQTLKAAADAGVPVIAYGRFVNDVLNFLIVAGAVFLMVKQVNRIKSSIDKPAACRRADDERVPILRLDDFDQGDALPELHFPAVIDGVRPHCIAFINVDGVRPHGKRPGQPDCNASSRMEEGGSHEVDWTAVARMCGDAGRGV